MIPDISHYHPVKDWSKLNVDFLISKATQGTSFIDSTLASFITGCESRGIPYWLYVFLDKGNEKNQTEFMIKTCKDKVGPHFVGYILDIESGNSPSNVKEAMDYLDSVGSKYMIYTMYAQFVTYKEIIENRGNDCAWWEARYGQNNGSYNSAYKCHDSYGVDLHQFTSKGSCEGIGSNCLDLSRITGYGKPLEWFTTPQNSVQKQEVKDMDVKIVHASISENGNAGWDGKAKAGDQTGKEVCVRTWYSKPWNVRLRYKDSTIAKQAAEIAVKLANSNLVGYDQSQRNTLYQQLKANNFDVDAYIRSGVKTETDCSAFVYACYCCVIPEMRKDSNAPTTSTMRNYFKPFGFSPSTLIRYTSVSNYLKTGDILIKEGSHTVMVINDGGQAEQVTGATTTLKPSVPDYTLQYGMTGDSVKLLQKCLNWFNANIEEDGSFGPKTKLALMNWQSSQNLEPDGSYGPLSHKKMKTLLS